MKFVTTFRTYSIKYFYFTALFHLQFQPSTKITTVWRVDKIAYFCSLDFYKSDICRSVVVSKVNIKSRCSFLAEVWFRLFWSKPDPNFDKAIIRIQRFFLRRTRSGYRSVLKFNTRILTDMKLIILWRYALVELKKTPILIL